MNHFFSQQSLRKLFLHTAKLGVLCSIVSMAKSQEIIIRQVADTKTNTYVEVTELFSHHSLGGYHPVRVVISNNQKIPHRILLKFSDQSDYGNSLSTASDFPLSAAAGKTVTYDLIVPLSAQNGNGGYQMLKTTLSGTMGQTSNHETTPFEPDKPVVLLSDSLHGPNASNLDSELASRGGSSRGSSATFSSRFNPKVLPDDWRAYYGFDCMILTEDDWALIPPGQRNAILSWIRLGGRMILHAQGSPTPSSLGFPTDTSFGKILIRPIAADLRLPARKTVDLAYSGSGGTPKSRLTAIIDDFNSSWPLQDQFGEKSFNYVTFVLILIVFGIVVGPVNLFVFAKSGRRHRLFITTPIISLATSVILVALIILQDGFGGDGRRIVLMEVRPDENQNAAFIHQEQFSRTGVMTSSGFSVDASAYIAPVPIDQSRWSRFTDDWDTSGSYNLQPAEGKLFASGGWFQSRSEQGQVLAAVVPTRGRIEATKDSNTLISTFDFPIETLLHIDADGNWFRADNITKGKDVKLSQVDPTMIQPVLNEISSKFTERNKSFFKKVYSRKDHFVAFTDAAPAIETHSGIDWETTTIITGPIAR
ncbi:MAG: hypothetical protein AB8D78_10110 [Akkermansiaceae bacterium]